MTIPVVVELSTIGESPSAALAVVVNLLEKMGHAVVDLAEQGDLASDRMRAFHGNIEALREATSGEYDDLTLVNVALTAQHMQLRLNGEQMATVFRLAKRASDQGIMPLASGVESLMRAMATGRTRSLVPFGFDIEKVKGATDQAGEIMRQAKLRAEALGEGMDTAGDAVARGAAQWANWKRQMAQAFSENQRLAGSLDHLAQSFMGANASAEEFGSKLGDAVAHAVDMATVTVYRAVHAFNLLRQAFEDVMGAFTPGANMQELIDRSQARVEGERDRRRGLDAHESAGLRNPDGSYMEGSGQHAGNYVTPFQEPGGIGGAEGGGGGGGGATKDIDYRKRALLSLVEYERRVQDEIRANEQRMQEERLRQLQEFNDAWMEKEQSRADGQLAKLMEQGRQFSDAWNGYQERRQFVHDQGIALQKSEIDSYQQWANATTSIARDAATTFGLSRGAEAWMTAIESGVEATFETARALVPGGQAHAPGAVALWGSTAFAFAKAAELGYRGRGSGGSGNTGAYRGGAPTGAVSTSSYGGGGTMGGSGAPPITVIFPNSQALATPEHVREAVRQALIESGYRGRMLPASAVES